MEQFKTTLLLRIIKRFFTSVIIGMVLTVAVLVIGITICSWRAWYGDELFYPILKYISLNRVSVVVSLIVIEIFILIFYHWKQTIDYLEDIITATENIYDAKEEWITLPQELKEIENQLNQIKINVRNNEIIAKEAEQRKNDLVVYLAHDLKTPLTSVIGYLTLLHDEQQISEELRQKYLSISLNKAERLEDLINEFFEITRFNLSNLTLELSTINLTMMLEQIIYEFKPIMENKELECSLKSVPDLMIKCDINKMQRVFDNLLRNAANYSFEKSKVEITVTEVTDSIHIKFVNRGNTISPEKLNRLFEQFYRLDVARTTQSGGAGLGLAIAKEIVELHHGRISAISENELIIFEVVLPML